jgi:hypothetical protein
MYDIIYISRYDIMYMHIPRLDTRIYTSLFSIDGALFLSNKHLVRGEEHLTTLQSNHSRLFRRIYHDSFLVAVFHR